MSNKFLMLGFLLLILIAGVFAMLSYNDLPLEHNDKNCKHQTLYYAGIWHDKLKITTYADCSRTTTVIR